MIAKADLRAVAREGERFLLAQAADLDAGNHNGPAVVHDTLTGKTTEPMPLQVWFKWANWEPATDEEYRAAVDNADQVAEAVS